jgi:hypothetical protein
MTILLSDDDTKTLLRHLLVRRQDLCERLIDQLADACAPR